MAGQTSNVATAAVRILAKDELTPLTMVTYIQCTGRVELCRALNGSIVRLDVPAATASRMLGR